MASLIGRTLEAVAQLYLFFGYHILRNMPRKTGLSKYARAGLSLTGMPPAAADALVRVVNELARRKKDQSQKKKKQRSKLSKLENYGQQQVMSRKVQKSNRKISFPAMSTVATKFFTSVIDPWHPEAMHASVPSKVVGPSYKTRTVFRTVMTCGSSGLGQVIWAPTLANNQNCVNVSNASTFSSETFAAQATAATGTIWAQMGGLPFTVANLTTASDANNVSGRIVAGGIRITYAGTESNKGGIYSMISFPDRSPVHGLGPSSTPSIGSFSLANVRAVDRKPLADSVFGLNPNEISFGNENEESTSRLIYPLSNGASYDTYIPCILGIYVSGAAAGSTFEVEIIQHSEYVGRGATNFVSASSADSAAYEQLLAGLTELEYAKSGLPNGDDPNIKAKMALQFCRRLNTRSALPNFSSQDNAKEGIFSLVSAGPFV